MKKCVYAWLQLNKCAEIRHTRHTAYYNITNSILLCCLYPWIRLRELKTQCNLLTLDILDQDPHLVSGLEYLLRVLNTAPAHLRNMKQSIRSAQVNECTEICHILNSSFHCITNLDSGEQFFFQLCLLCNQQLLSVANDPSSLGIELCNHKFNVLSGILGQIFLIAVRYKAGRDKYPSALNLNA